MTCKYERKIQAREKGSKLQEAKQEGLAVANIARDVIV